MNLPLRSAPRIAAPPPRLVAVSAPRPAVSGDAVVRSLEGALRDLDRKPDALAAASLCLDALQHVIPSRTSLVHAFDAQRRDFIVVHARGAMGDGMVLERSAAEDPLLRVAMPKGEIFPWNDLRKAPVARLARFAQLGQVTTVLVCPMISGTRWLGAIELVDMEEAAPISTRSILGARYVAQRYARFLMSRGVVVDIATIARFASSEPASARRGAGALTAAGGQPVTRMTRPYGIDLFRR